MSFSICIKQSSLDSNGGNTAIAKLFSGIIVVILEKREENEVKFTLLII
jgi:hypothetical protein